MQLKEALKRVIKICPKAKDAALFRSVRFVAGTGTEPSRVFTSDGVCMAAIPVDNALPDALISNDGLASAVKDSGDLEIGVTAEGQLSLFGTNGTYKLKSSENVDYFPSPPETPENFVEITWWLVQKVLHATARDQAGPELSVVHFSPEYIEAFDQVRLARVEMDGSWSGCVPARLFKHWPGGSVETVFNEHYAFFRIGGEQLRIANLTKLAYPDTDKLIAPITSGGSFLVDSERFRETIQQATEVSPINLVMLNPVMLNALEGAVRVVACDAGGTLDAYEGVVPSAVCQGTPGKATVDGKLLQQALKQCDTPNLKITVGENVDPLRIEAGNLIECIWQRYWE